MKKIILGVVCGVAVLSSMSSSLNVEASSKDAITSKEHLLFTSPFDVGYFYQHHILNIPHRLDPNPRTKLTSGAPVRVTINENMNSIPIKCRAYSPSTGEVGPWVTVGITGTAELPNNIPAGQTVVPEAIVDSQFDETDISGSWYHN